MSRLRGISCALLLSVFGGFMPAAAQDPVLIEELVVDGNRSLSSDAFFRLTSLKVGDPYDEDVLRKEFRRLWERGLFEDLSLESRDGETGKIIIFHLEERPRLNSIEYEKNKAITETQIEEVLAQKNVHLRIGAPVDYKAVQDTEEAIRGLLGAKGFLDPVVESDLDEVDPGTLSLRFTIKPGQKTKIRDVNFTGNEFFSDRQLKSHLEMTSEVKWWRLWGKKKTLYHPQKLSEDLRKVEEFYQSRGYLDIRVKNPQVEIVPGKPKKDPSKQKRFAVITVPVEEGQQYRVGKISVEGNRVFSDAEVLARIPLREGYVFNSSALKAGTQQLELAYGERGYFFVSTNRLIDRHEDLTADVTIKIDEDKKYFVDRIEFVGNTTTRDYVLRRELGVAEEELFNLKEFRLGLRKISQLGYFQLTKDPDIVPVPGESRVRITVEGQELSRNEIQVGGGYSGIDGAFFAGSFSTRNFMGRGQTLSTQLQIGGQSDTFAVSFQDPWFLGKPWIFGASVFRRNTDYVNFEQIGQGGTISFGKRLGNFSTISFTYLIEQVQVEQRPFPSAESTTSSVRPLFVYDTRNNFIRPTRGFRLVFSFEFAGGPLGGDNFFYKPILEATYYLRAFKRTYFGLHGEIGYIDDFAGRRAPDFERFYLGGERSLRMYRSRSVSPQDDGTYPIARPRGSRHVRTIVNPLDPTGSIVDPLDPPFYPGGNKYLLFNFEYVIPAPGDTPVELALFFDAGNSWNNNQSYDLSDLRKDVGLEVRFFLPVFGAPLRLIYGWNLDPGPFDDDNDFIFSIGTTF